MSDPIPEAFLALIWQAILTRLPPGARVAGAFACGPTSPCCRAITVPAVTAETA